MDNWKLLMKVETTLSKPSTRKFVAKKLIDIKKKNEGFSDIDIIVKKFEMTTNPYSKFESVRFPGI